MKKIILPLLFFFGLATAEAQTTCTPDTTIKQAGMYPSYLPDAKAGFAYKETIQFKFPKDTNFMNTTVPIDSIRLVKVEGLPAGFTFKCNSNDRCRYLGGENGCVEIFGNPTEAMVGHYAIVITGEGYAKFANVPLPPAEFKRTLELHINSANSFNIAKKNASTVFDAKQNQPNPFSKSTLIQYNSPGAQQVSFKVYDILGHTVYTKNFMAANGENTITFDRNNLKNGIYFYSLQMGSQLITKKMTIRD